MLTHGNPKWDGIQKIGETSQQLLLMKMAVVNGHYSGVGKKPAEIRGLSLFHNQKSIVSCYTFQNLKKHGS